MSYPMIFSTPGVASFAEAVDDERARQLAKWGHQAHPDGTGRSVDTLTANRLRTRCQELDAVGQVTWRDILAEEVAEAFAETDPEKLEAELIQIAAVTAAWIVDLKNRPAVSGG